MFVVCAIFSVVTPDGGDGVLHVVHGWDNNTNTLGRSHHQREMVTLCSLILLQLRDACKNRAWRWVRFRWHSITIIPRDRTHHRADAKLWLRDVFPACVPDRMQQEVRPPERFLEMHRLTHIVKVIDRAVAVVPKGALLVEVKPVNITRLRLHLVTTHCMPQNNMPEESPFNPLGAHLRRRTPLGRTIQVLKGLKNSLLSMRAVR